MNDNEIIKALECCQKLVGSGACNDCPLKHIRNKRLSYDEKSCTTILIENVLNLITRQNADIENLNKDLADTIALNYEERKGLKAEIERLKEFEYMYNDLCK